MTKTTRVHGWNQSKDESDASFETSMGDVATHYWGKPIGTEGMYSYNTDINYEKYTTQGSWTGNIGGEAAPLASWTDRFIPVNGIPFYAVCGKATHTVAGQTQTIVPMTKTEGAKPRYKHYELVATGKTEFYGVVYGRYDIEYAGGTLTGKLTGMGQKYETSTASPVAPIYPDSEAAPFKVFDSITWNSEALDVQSVTCSIFSVLKPHTGEDGFYTTIEDVEPIYVGYSIVLNSFNANVETDYKAKTERTLTFKCTKADVTKYFEITNANAFIHHREMPDGRNEVCHPILTIIAPGISAVVVDDVADSFYEIPT